MADGFWGGFGQSLGQGLQTAGEILSPAVAQRNFQQRQMELASQLALQRGQRELAARAIIAGVQSGSIDPQLGRQKLAQLGMGDIPVGPSLEARGNQAFINALQGPQTSVAPGVSPGSAPSGPPEAMPAPVGAQPQTQGMSLQPGMNDATAIEERLRSLSPVAMASPMGQQYVQGLRAQLEAIRAAQPQYKFDPNSGKMIATFPDGRPPQVIDMPALGKGQWSDPYQIGGATVQKNTVTGEIRTAVPRPPITNVFGAKGKPPSGYRWGPDDEQGNPTLIPIGGGPADVGKSADETAQAIANYQLPMLTGWVLKSPWGQRVMGRVTELNPQYDSRLFQAGQKVISDFAGGKTGQMVQSFNVVIQHTAVMRNAADALKNGDIRLFNALTQRFAQETGQPAPTNFDGVKRVWGNEIVKAVTGSAGALGDRETIEKGLSRANSPEQLLGLMDQYEYLMAGQVLGARKRYESNSGRKDFDKFLLPATLDAMKKHGYSSDTTSAPVPAQAPQDIQDLLKKYGGGGG